MQRVIYSLPSFTWIVCRHLGIVTFPPGELRWIQDLTLLWNSTQSAIQWYKDMLSAAAVTTINCDGTYHGCGLKPGPARSCLQARSCQELLAKGHKSFWEWVKYHCKQLWITTGPLSPGPVLRSMKQSLQKGHLLIGRTHTTLHQSNWFRAF